MFDLSSSILTNMPLPVDILRNYTLEFEIKVEMAPTDLREYLRKVVKDKDCCRELANTLMEDIEEMSSVQKHELVTFRSKLNRRGPDPPSTKVKYA